MPPLDLIAWLLVGVWAILVVIHEIWLRRADWPLLASSAVLVLLAWYGYALAESDVSVRYAGFIAAGMTMGLIGDLYMAKLLPAPARELAGMIAFGLCHVFYITAVVTYAPVGWLAWLLWVILGTVIAYLVVVRTDAPTILRRAAFGYALLLSSTAGVTTGLALQRPIFTGLALGGVLFLISDTFIAIDLYNKHRLPAISSLIWLTYGPAQALIVASIWATFQP